MNEITTLNHTMIATLLYTYAPLNDATIDAFADLIANLPSLDDTTANAFLNAIDRRRILADLDLDANDLIDALYCATRDAIRDNFEIDIA